MFAFAAAILVLNRRGLKVGIDPDVLVMFYQIIIIAALLGSRLLHFVFAEPALFFSDPLVFFDVNQGGFAFYGGAIGGALSGIAYIRWKNIPFWKLLDAAAPTLMLGLAVGRMGCFFAGCCHGRSVPGSETGTLLSMPGGSIVFVDGAPVIAFNFVSGVGVGSIHGEAIYPTQMFESLGALSIFLFLELDVDQQATLRRPNLRGLAGLLPSTPQHHRDLQDACSRNRLVGFLPPVSREHPYPPHRRRLDGGTEPRGTGSRGGVGRRGIVARFVSTLTARRSGGTMVL